MATSDILGLFTTPEQYQLAQRQAQEAQAIQFAQLNPMARANYGTFRAGQQIGGAIGGALGGEDPQLKLISQRQQILGMIDPTNPDSFAQGIQMALQTGDTQTAFILRNEMMRAKEQAQQQEIRGFEREKFLLDRGMTMRQRGMEAAALSVANGIDPETGLRGKSILNERGEVIDTQALKPLIDPITNKFNQDVANTLISQFGQVGVNIVKQRLEGVQGVESLQEKQLAKDRLVKANELFSNLKKSDGTIDETVKAELLSFPEGRALITQQAEVLKPLRQLSAGGVAEVNPFQRFLDDPNAPAFIKNSAQQLKNSFDAGVYNEEQTDKYVTRLDEAMGRLEPKAPSFGAEAERKSKRLFGKPYSALTQQEAAVVDQAVEASEKGRVPPAPIINMTVQNQMQKGFGENLTETITSNIKAGRLARPILGAVDSMQILLDEGVRTGFGQETMMQVGKVGQVFNPDFNIKGLAGQEALQSIATNLVLPQVKQLGVNPTDTDLKFINTGSPSLSKTVAGNKLMLSALRLKGERDQDLSRFTNTWLSQNTKLTTTNPTEAFVKFNSDFDTYTQSSPLYAPSASKLREQFNALGSTTQKGGSKPDARTATDRGGLTKPKP